MKSLVVIFLSLSVIWSFAGQQSIGTIVEGKGIHAPKTVGVEYSYSKDNKLILTFKGVAMNAAAKGIKGSITVEDGTIKIMPHEIYGEDGPFDSVKTYTLKYTINNVSARAYKVQHDDSRAEGIDRLVTFPIDLAKSPSGKINVIPQEYYMEDITPDDLWDSKYRRRLTPKKAQQVVAPDR